MPTLDEIREYCDNDGSPALKVDGHDNAIIGAGNLGPDNEYVMVYSEQRLLKNLEDQGMSKNEALEYYEFNIVGAYMGPGTPIYIDEVEKE